MIRLFILLALTLTAIASPAWAVYQGAIVEKIWTLPSAPGTVRWLIIREKTQDKRGELYHIEVLEKKDGQKDWQFKRLTPHMAVTENALRWSLVKFQRTGDVYPESYDAAYKAWSSTYNAPICTSSVNKCLTEDRFQAKP